MQITHFGHSAILIEVDGVRLLLDPGNFSDAWHGVTDLAAVLVTHQHGDHVHPEKLSALLADQPDCQVYVEPEVLDKVPLSERAKGLPADASISFGGIKVSAVGGRHAVIHRDIPIVGNVGLVIEAEGHPTVFHPGDALDAIPAGIDVCMIPALGPWAALKETVEFTRGVAAPVGFLIHDALLSERGVSVFTRLLTNLTPTTLVDIRDTRPWTPQG